MKKGNLYNIWERREINVTTYQLEIQDFEISNGSDLSFEVEQYYYQTFINDIVQATEPHGKFQFMIEYTSYRPYRVYFFKINKVDKISDIIWKVNAKKVENYKLDKETFIFRLCSYDEKTTLEWYEGNSEEDGLLRIYGRNN